ncbi:uncharacterized protein LOC117102676 [Anneissia japonica]|uniref:uncharacterized protein LOC117102676 n=1 Tax=Anneissia japonica TaxID=1529436 RepID=UPI001425546C|nr:uncharacterized protein LOC117102676 [Anneissia japonica]
MQKVKEYLDSLDRNEPEPTGSTLPLQVSEPANPHLQSLNRKHNLAAMQTSMVYTIANTPIPSVFYSGSIPTSSPMPYNLASHNVVKPTQMLDVTPEGSRNGGEDTSSPKDQVNDVLQTLLQKQGEVLLQWAIQSGLPKKELTKFSGDPTDYGRFVRAFEHEVEGKVKEDRDRLYYLEQYTSGDVNQLVRSCMAMEAKKGYAEAKKALAARYGNPFKLADAYFNKVKSFPDIKVQNKIALSRFSLVLIECKNAMSDLNHLQELNHTRSIQSLTKKLPYRLRDKWRTKTDYILEDRRVEFKDFVEFVERQSRILDNPTFGDIKEEKTSHKPIHKHGGTFAVTDTRSCSHCKGNHTLSKCSRFDGLPREAKSEFIRKNKLCYGCLGAGHLSKNCSRRHTCVKCKKGHPTTLHRGVVNEMSASAGGSVKEEVTASCDNGEGNCALAIVPVQVRAQRGSKVVITYAFLDPGSTISFCSDGLLQSLGVRGRPARISIETMGSRHSLQTETVKNLMVRAVDGDEEVPISMVYSKQSLPVAKVHIPKQEDIDRWPHLNGVKIPKIDSEIGLLIGMGVPSAYTPL